jgi:hypothetical protein
MDRRVLATNPDITRSTRWAIKISLGLEFRVLRDQIAPENPSSQLHQDKLTFDERCVVHRVVNCNGETRGYCHRSSCVCNKSQYHSVQENHALDVLENHVMNLVEPHTKSPLWAGRRTKQGSPAGRFDLLQIEHGTDSSPPNRAKSPRLDSYHFRSLIWSHRFGENALVSAPKLTDLPHSSITSTWE